MVCGELRLAYVATRRGHDRLVPLLHRQVVEADGAILAHPLLEARFLAVQRGDTEALFQVPQLAQLDDALLTFDLFGLCDLQIALPAFFPLATRLRIDGTEQSTGEHDATLVPLSSPVVVDVQVVQVDIVVNDTVRTHEFDKVEAAGVSRQGHERSSAVSRWQQQQGRAVGANLPARTAAVSSATSQNVALLFRSGHLLLPQRGEVAQDSSEKGFCAIFANFAYFRNLKPLGPP